MFFKTIISEFACFILGTDRNVETIEGCTHKLRNRLMERCDHLSEEVKCSMIPYPN